MKVDINLLPQAYIKAKRHEQWFHRGIAIWLSLVAIELGGGLALHIRAGDTHQIAYEAEMARNAIKPLKAELATNVKELSAIKINIALAEHLRATHRWSRLLAALSQAAPDRVVLSSIATDPMSWSQPADTAPHKLAGQQSAKAGKRNTTMQTESPIKAIIVRGDAADHASLSRYLNALRETGVFASFDLRHMKRHQQNGQDLVGFELVGKW